MCQVVLQIRVTLSLYQQEVQVIPHLTTVIYPSKHIVVDA